MKLCVVTLVSGRRTHLGRQHAGLARSHRAPDDYVVVAMGDPSLADWTPAEAPVPHVVHLAVDGALPLAAARNLGARAAVDHGDRVRGSQATGPGLRRAGQPRGGGLAGA